MRATRHVLVVAMALVAALVAVPALAQTTAPQAPPAKEQGLGIFLQGGYVRGSTYNSSGLPNMTSFNPQGFLVGLGFGGNKSGGFGIGADLNYVMKTASDVTLIGFFNNTPETLKSYYLNVPVYGRINMGGHNTKEAATFYLMFGGYVDILLKSSLNGLDVKSQFNGLDVGPLAGAGFEVARIGVEARGLWALRTLQSTGDGTFLNGMERSHQFTLMVLVKVRLN